jgi:hypothetical protein
VLPSQEPASWNARRTTPPRASPKSGKERKISAICATALIVAVSTLEADDDCVGVGSGVGAGVGAGVGSGVGIGVGSGVGAGVGALVMVAPGPWA